MQHPVEPARGLDCVSLSHKRRQHQAEQIPKMACPPLHERRWTAPLGRGAPAPPRGGRISGGWRQRELQSGLDCGNARCTCSWWRSFSISARRACRPHEKAWPCSRRSRSSVHQLRCCQCWRSHCSCLHQSGAREMGHCQRRRPDGNIKRPTFAFLAVAVEAPRAGVVPCILVLGLLRSAFGTCEPWRGSPPGSITAMLWRWRACSGRWHGSAPAASTRPCEEKLLDVEHIVAAHEGRNSTQGPRTRGIHTGG